MHTSGVLHVVQVSPLGQNHVYLVPVRMLGSWVAPQYFMSVFVLVSVRQCQLVEGAQFKDSLAVLVRFAIFMMTRSNPCFEVSHDEGFFLAGYASDDRVKDIVEPVLLVCGGA